MTGDEFQHPGTCKNPTVTSGLTRTYDLFGEAREILTALDAAMRAEQIPADTRTRVTSRLVWGQAEGATAEPVKPARCKPPAIATTQNGRYTPEWFERLAASYAFAVANWRSGGGQPPAKELAEQAGVPINTVRSWIYRARRAGYLPEGRQGVAG